MRQLGAGRDDPGHQHGVHRRNCGECSAAGVVFAGFVGYSLMITAFTPMLMRGDGRF
jgi:hypothetical protein